MWMKSDENVHQLVKVESASFKESQMAITCNIAKNPTLTSATTASIFTRHQARNEGKLQSTRWSPTAEQLMALEELYRHGTRTPTALQIQEITVKLRRFGKIEGKNVFYWFQNHKARDKKKQRLKMEAALRSSKFKLSQTNTHNLHYSKTNQSEVLGSEGARVTSLEVDQTKHEPLSNCSTSSEESASGPLVAKTPTKTSTNQTKEAIMQCHYSSWKPMEMSFCFPIMNLVKNNPLVPINNTNLNYSHTNYEISEGSSVQTLELFPLQSDNVKRDDDQDPKSLTFVAGNCGLSKLDLSLSLVSMEN